MPSTSAAATADQPDNQNMPSAAEGWALKKVKIAVNFSENVRNYLREVFLLGEETGHKANPGLYREKEIPKKRVVDHCADFPLFQQAINPQ